MISDCEKYKKKLSVNADYRQLNLIRHFIEDNATEFGFDSKTANMLALAVDETCTNLINHAYKKDKSKSISIFLECSQNAFVIKIIDNSDAFNPINCPAVNMIEYFKLLKKGGLGVHLIKLVVDDIEYIPADGSITQNTLILKKYL